MLWSSWFDKVSPLSPVSRHSRSNGRARPTLERLESRTLLNGDAEFDPTTLLVRFRSEQEVAATADILPGSILGDPVELVPGLRTVTLPANVRVPDAVAVFQASPLVQYAEPNYLVHATRIPNDPLYNTLYGMTRISAPQAWDVATGGGTTRVAIIDTGINYNHPDLAANIDPVNRGYNFINNTPNPLDDNGHGSHVAGTIGAVGNNAVGVVGVNWRVRMMGLKFLSAGGSGTTANAIRAVDYAVAQGVGISNNSWGGGGFSQGLLDSLRNAGNRGHIFVAAAGNANNNNDNAPFYPCNYHRNGAANVVCVAATNSADARAGFSNYGRLSVHLGAPGDNINSTSLGSGYRYLSGTSMATPHVTGVMALVRDLRPAWTYTQVVNQVLNTADRIPSMNGITVTGGRLNAAAAVRNLGGNLPCLSISDVTVTEGNVGQVLANFPVRLSQTTGQAVSVRFATANGSAQVSDSDYVANSGTLTIPAGATTGTIQVRVNGDVYFENNEAFLVNLVSPVNATICDSQGVGTITNDDAPPRITIDDLSFLEGHAGQTTVNFTVRLSAPSGLSAIMDYATASGSATSGIDFVATSGTLMIPARATSGTIQVRILGDQRDEVNEDFFVNLTNPRNATFADAQGRGTILDDDPQPDLVVAGTALADTILVRSRAGDPNVFEVLLNGQVQADGPWAALTSLTIEGGTGNDLIRVMQVRPGLPVAVNGGDGDDEVVVGPNLNAIGGSLAVSGNAGNDALTVDDSAGPELRDIFITAATVRRADTGTVTYLGFEGLTVRGSSLGGTGFNLADTAAGTPVTVVGAGEDYLFGPDSGARFSVTGPNAGRLTGNGLASPVTFSGVGNLLGGAGDDTFAFADGRGLSGYVEGRGGNNTLDYTAWTSGVYVDLLNYVAFQGAVYVFDIVYVFGGAGDDYFHGDARGNWLVGNAGHDILVGDEEGDWLQGGAGNDQLYGGNGFDQLDGGDGDDLLIDGPTAYDYDVAALSEIWTEWTRTDLPGTPAEQYAQRLAILRTGTPSGYVLDASTVFTDVDADLLYGEGGLDWFWGIDGFDVMDRLDPDEVLN